MFYLWIREYYGFYVSAYAFYKFRPERIDRFPLSTELIYVGGCKPPPPTPTLLANDAETIFRYRLN